MVVRVITTVRVWPTEHFVVVAGQDVTTVVICSVIVSVSVVFELVMLADVLKEVLLVPRGVEDRVVTLEVVTRLVVGV